MVLLCLFLGWAIYGDLKKGKISNYLISGFALTAFCLGYVNFGIRGVTNSVFGMLIGGLPLFIPYIIGGFLRKPLMGAGDVKLMAAIGVFVGPFGVFWSMYYGFLIAGIIAFSIVIINLIRKKPIPRTIPLGAMLSTGTALALFFKGNLFMPQL